MARNRTSVLGTTRIQVAQARVDECCAVFRENGMSMETPATRLPPYSTVHSFYRRARLSGLWDSILRHLVKKTREYAGRKPGPSYGIIDSQSVKSVGASEERGIDGEKKRKARSGISS